MKKQVKKNITIGAIISIVLILFIVLMGSGAIKFPLSIYGSGLTITSISKNIDVISPSTLLSGVWFLINARSNGGQSLVGTITPTDMKGEIGYESEFPLTIEASALDEKVEYKIQNTATPIFTFSKVETNSPSGCSSTAYFVDNAPSCPSGTSYEIKIVQARIGTSYICKRVCVSKVQAGVLGTIEPASAKQKIKIALTARGERIEKEIAAGSNADFNSATLGLIATAQIPGNLWTGNYPPSGQGYKGFYNIGTNIWKITSDSRVADYNAKMSEVTSYLQTQQEVTTGILICPEEKCTYKTLNDYILAIEYTMSKVNVVAGAMKQDNLAIGSSQTLINPSDPNNGKVVLDIDAQLGVADIVLKVRANWLGIKIPVGKPQILSSSCPDFKSGENGRINVQVRNIGSAEGSFVPSISCGTIKQSYTQTAVSVPSQQTREIVIPIDAVTFAGTQIDTCSIKIQDYNLASNYATSSVTCKILKPATCIENQIYIENNCIKRCVNGNKIDLKCCSSTEQMVYDTTLEGNIGGYSCLAKGSGSNKTEDGSSCKSCENYVISSIFGNFIKPSKCENNILGKLLYNNITCSLTFVKLIGVPIIFLISLLFLKDFLSKRKEKKLRKNEWLQWVISIVVSLGIAILLWFLWWLAVLLLIGLVILKFMM